MLESLIDQLEKSKEKPYAPTPYELDQQGIQEIYHKIFNRKLSNRDLLEDKKLCDMITSNQYRGYIISIVQNQLVKRKIGQKVDIGLINHMLDIKQPTSGIIALYVYCKYLKY